ncbi:uncharacterized protein LOC128264009 [Drosophila gunungcola]|uniref:uncharacterized protein LOC128264009 n=1 Tax=Drosophila gunungcola TaxID=103775 RepID=UPI0022E47039|nr:uncharacterized protein LOC128264009 [Drosophila gunungcola]
MIAKLTEPENNVHWDNVIKQVEHALNNTVHRSIRQIPSKMLFGVEQRGQIIDELRDKLEEINNTAQVENLDEIRKLAMEKQIQAQKYNETYYDKTKKTPKDYTKGDFDNTAGVARKLIPKNKGPYTIAKVLRNDRFLLKDVEGFQVSRNPYKGVWSAQNIRPWIGKRKK